MDVSFVVPVFNTKATFLNDCLKSLLNQKTSLEFEVLLVNDGSTSRETLDFLNTIKLSNVRVINKENTGVSETRNTGIAKSNGKYVSFVDSDDYLDENFLASSEKEIRNNVDVIYFNNTVMIGDKKKNKNVVSDYVVWAKIFKKEFLNFNNIYFDKKLDFCEDFIFMKAVFSLQNTTARIGLPLYIYRQNKFNASNKYDETASTKFNKSLLAMKPYLSDKEFITNCFMFYLVYVLPKCVFNKELRISFLKKRKKAISILNDKNYCYFNGLQLKKNYVNKIRYCQFFLVKHKLYLLSNIIGHLINFGKTIF